MPKIIGSVKLFIVDYLSRHRNNLNRIFHVIGIPLVIFGIFKLFTGRYKGGLINIFLGYLLQWIGHRHLEKNELGEWLLIKKIIRTAIKR